MPRKPSRKLLTEEDVRAAADRAEGKVAMQRIDHEPDRFHPRYTAQAEKLCAMGATDVEIADFFGISTDTLAMWRRQSAEFNLSIKIGASVADDRVERSLFQLSVGYTYVAEKVVVAMGVPTVVKYRHHVPPDRGSIEFWLKNRRGDDWREKQEIAITKASIDDYTDQELADIATGRTVGHIASSRGTKLDS
jgi:hypothetical protein